MKHLCILPLVLLLCACWDTPHAAHVTALTWERRIPVERFVTVREQGWTVASGGRVVSTDWRWHHSDRYACGYDTRTTGTGKDRRTTTETRYCSRSVYRDWYTWDRDAWAVVRQFQALGTHADERRWPDATDFHGCASEALGCERLGSRIERLVIVLVDADRDYEVECTDSLWVPRHLGEAVTVVTDWRGTVVELRQGETKL